MARSLTTAIILSVLAVACSSNPSAEPEEIPTRPLPTVTMAGRPITVYPLTMLLPEPVLGWDEAVGPRATALARADSLLKEHFTNMAPEIQWVWPEQMRRTARQAPNMFPDPDHIATAQLRHGFQQVPDPLRSQLRMLTGAAGDRLALVPASLFFFREDSGLGRAELSMALVDVRTGEVRWQSVARGEGDDPWVAFRSALLTLTPISP